MLANTLPGQRDAFQGTLIAFPSRYGAVAVVHVLWSIETCREDDVIRAKEVAHRLGQLVQRRCDHEAQALPSSIVQLSQLLDRPDDQVEAQQ